LVELLFVIAIMVLLTGILMPALAEVRLKSARMACGANLSDLGRAMLIYANDYDNAFPRAGFPMTVWADKIIDWDAVDRIGAYGLPTASQASITSSFYLLVKYAEVTTESFICAGDPSVTVFEASDYIAGMENVEAWDFGDNDGTTLYPTNHCSYSYHTPYNLFFLSTASSDPGMAVAADQNPFLDYSTLPGSTNFFWYSDDPVAGEDIKVYQLGNTGAHEREGQNVLYMDIHVDFENQSFCAIYDDNIYTYQQTGLDIRQGVQPQCDTYNIQPATSKDSLLVNECGSYFGTTTTTLPPTVTITTITKPIGCFPGDALVWVDGKLAQISQAIPGQNVGKLDSASPAACLAVAPSLKAIEGVEEHPANQFGAGDCYDIMLESGNYITVVYSHFVLTDAGQWVDVRDLTSGSKLMSINGPITVTSVVKRATPFVGTSYNLKIKGAERYFVGKDGIVARDW